MRILFVHRNARLSGLTTYVRSLLPALRARGHQCELVVRPGTGSAGLAAALGKRPWWHPPPAGWAARKIEKIIRREGIDLVNAQTRRCAVHALPACRRTGTPLVMTLHSITDLSGCKEAVEYARALVVMNENARHYYADRYPGLADKLRLTRLPVELSRFRPAGIRHNTVKLSDFIRRQSMIIHPHIIDQAVPIASRCVCVCTYPDIPLVVINPAPNSRGTF